MIDFVEYVVAELAKKRLSKPEAVSLIRQFQSRAQSGQACPHIHPLLHTNLSDLYQQSYSSWLDGSEFFLRDHRVQGRPVLPGVATLEMARAAMSSACAPEQGEAIELRNVVWAQPLAVTQPTDVSISLIEDGAGRDGRQLDFEVTSLAADAGGDAEETVHVRGGARVVKAPQAIKLDLEHLAGQMRRGRLEAPALYAIYAKLGIDYGPAQRAVGLVRQGEGQLLAQLELPDAVAGTLDDYLLHPSLMDAAVQSALGFIDGVDKVPDQLRLPFALDSLRIFGACTRTMVAWLRPASGTGADDRVSKLDIDLCDTDGNVRVQMRGFASRIVPAQDGGETLYATMAWEAAPAPEGSGAALPGQRHVVLCGFPAIGAQQLEAALPGWSLLSLPDDPAHDPATRYTSVAVACFGLIKRVLGAPLDKQALIQVVVPRTGGLSMLAGLSGMLKSATLENPALRGQVIMSDPEASAEELARQLRQDAAAARDAVVQHDEQGARLVLALRELSELPAAPSSPLREEGVYLVTGGLGGLGMLFAASILQRCAGARVILAGRGEPDAGTQARLERLSGGERAHYRQLDLADTQQTRAAIEAIVRDHGRLDGILHAAGMIADSFILKKSEAQFRQVLEPKVAGTVNLDEATRGLDLDFLVLFSAGAAVTGNLGQADYAAANGFMDYFAAYRNALAGAGQRKGKTRSVNWPLWAEGGMATDSATRRQLQDLFGMTPLGTRTGLKAFDLCLALPHERLLVAQGESARLRRTLFAAPADASVAAAAPAPSAQADMADLDTSARDYLKQVLSRVLKLPPSRVDAAAPFEKYGIDSILMMELTNALEQDFGSLPKTLFFEYGSIAELARYFAKVHAARLAALPGRPAGDAARAPAAGPAAPAAPVRTAAPPRSRVPRRMRAERPAPAQEAGPIAIVGLSGRYPQSPDLGAFWENLRDGKDCVTEVPLQRWDWRKYFTDDRSKTGQHYSKWGGFIEGVDEFDPLFFNISPREARMIDPQERLFLQHAWMAIEDAGYTRAGLRMPREDGRAGMVGVYVGVMYGEYNLSGSLASIANRVSYVLNLHGPSMTLDTMCSSSLTAIHLACQDLKQGRTDAAIAGGVNVSIHPGKYLLLSAGQFISGDGHCQSFGEGGDGYIPGEGVGAVMLKRLADAQRDGDHIYGLIRGSELNHGGKTNGYTVPNPHAQAGVIRQALAEAGTDPRHISYVEAHGTGTKLGDPIEILALSNAFYHGAQAKESGFCAIGSAKSNIGHCESAAGIAGLTKILLQMRHRQIVPSLHSARLNPNIDFGATPFTVNQALRPWERPVVDGREIARIAGLSSFGAGGANAHIVVEEYQAPAAAGQPWAGQVVVPLSARTPDQLKQKARDLLAFMRSSREPLAGIAYTLQLGREAMDERVGFIADSADRLMEQLAAYVDGQPDIEGVAQGRVRRHDDPLSVFGDDADLRETVGKWLARKQYGKLLGLWVGGVEVEWDKLHDGARPARVSLPAYPFARDKYWIEKVGQVVPDAIADAGVAEAVLHPLLHKNTSNLDGQSYRSRFDGAEWFLLPMGRHEESAPAGLYLEMARAALDDASGAQPDGTILELTDIAWGRPAPVAAGMRLDVALVPFDGGQVGFDVYTAVEGEDIVHCQGRATYIPQSGGAGIALAPLKQRMRAEPVPGADGAAGVVALWKGEADLLVQLSLRNGEDGDYGLHPALLAHVTQAARALAGAAALPFTLGAVRVAFGGARDVVAWIRPGQAGVAPAGTTLLDVDVCDLHGTACIEMRGLAMQAPVQSTAVARLVDAAPAARGPIRLAAPDALASPAPAGAPRTTVRLSMAQEASAPAAPSPVLAPAMPAPAPAPAMPAPAAKLALPPAAPTRGELLAQLKASLADALYMDPSEIDAGRPFVELGLDSIVGVEWVKAINKQYALAISATTVYDYPTLDSLASLVAQELAARPAPAAAHAPDRAEPVAPAPETAPQPQPQPQPLPSVSLPHLMRQLQQTLADALYMSPQEVDPGKPFVELGLDSIVGVEWIKVINKQFGLNVSATRVYDYPDIASLAAFLAGEIASLPATARPAAVPADEPGPAVPMAAAAAKLALPAPAHAVAPAPAASSFDWPALRRQRRAVRAAPAAAATAAAPARAERIAIVGMSGRYPQARDLHEYWDNLAQGRNAIVEIPPSRWDVQQYFDPQPGSKGKVYSKWLGMLDDADCFDPLFFQISPAEAESMDPQHRLFMQEAYRAFEDAGYSNKTLSNRKCGVYLGIMNNEYSLLLSRAGSATVDTTGTSYAIGAARIAYHLNLKGPAIPIDTACSSSLVAIHLASQALLNGEIDMALAGGSTLYLTPDSYLGMCQAGMLSPDGQCKAFDNQANGFVPGEGVGALVLKRLSDAEADKDHIHGVILASAINQDGKTNGITAPSISSQVELERSLYARYDIDPRSITYVETHGTGTKLGDPIELEALATVFSEKGVPKNHCGLGSVKSNIGHTSAAAGVASVQKVLLSMRHRTLAPTLHVAQENTLFDFAGSPFYICRERRAWDTPAGVPRRAAVSSFGFSGTNAHLVIEEYVQPAHAQGGDAGAAAIVLSARTAEQLRGKARDLLDFVQRERQHGDVDLASMAYTLQVGREAFRERLACVAASAGQLAGQLQAFLAGAAADGMVQGKAARDQDALSPPGAGGDLRDTVDGWIARRELVQLAAAWTKGVELDWSRLYAAVPARMSLPGYPFAKERYWVGGQALPPAAVASPAPVVARERLYYVPAWADSSLGANVAQTASSRATLVLAADGALLQAMSARRAQAQGAPLVRLVPGADYAEVAPDVFSVDVRNEAHFQLVLDTLAARGIQPGQVVHCCPRAEEMTAQLEHGVYALFNLCKALMRQKRAQPMRLLSVFAGASQGAAPEYAALGAFYRTLAQENPAFAGRAVEVRACDDAGIADVVLAELDDPHWQVADVRYLDPQAGGARQVRALRRWSAPAAAQLPLRQGGSYLITGGLGGLGLLFAGHLAREFGARVVLVGRSAPSGSQQDALRRIGAAGGEVSYLQGDVCRLEDMERVVAETRRRHGRIDGVIHGAGVIRDAYLLQKTLAEMESVLAAKLQGAYNLDRACAGEALDLFVMFSSVAGTLGNAGQCDYAYANRFLDCYAEQREALRAAGQRSGRTLSIAWPLWIEGGMSVSADDVARSEGRLGVSPLPTPEGFECWHELLGSDLAQALALYGQAERIEAALVGQDAQRSAAGAALAQGGEGTGAPSRASVEDYLRQLVGAELKLAPELLDPQERFDAYGIDSIVVGRLNAILERELGALPKTLFYEYQTIEALAEYLARAAAAALGARLGGSDEPASAPAQEPQDMRAQEEPTLPSAAIAIIGVHGSFPRSADLAQYWDNLKHGRDLVGLVPADRWDSAALYDPDPARAADGKIYCKWGGFLDDVDRFDAAFFNIPAHEAALIDPQERLFLQAVWSAIEDAGYTRDSLRQRHPRGKSADVGVFVGVTNTTYQLLQAQEWERQHFAAPGSLPWSIANRVSYFFDFQGPSMPVDTACSSSLAAIHLACESLARQESQVAVAGGVNLYLHPAKYHSFCQRGMLAMHGRCRSYGAGDDGFVPAEALGALVLKPLERAIADGDHVHAVIAGSAVEHGGRSNGYSAPNPHSQASVIGKALARAGVDADTISHVEGHGTGTQLGDNLEISALTQAFRTRTARERFCSVGSVKASMGHAESAAGIAGVLKVMLQMRHRQLVPSLHSALVNPDLALAGSPFYLQHELAAWDCPAGQPRRALVNSFGAGGVNACVVMEEYVAPAVDARGPARGPQLVVLSARTAERLETQAAQLLAFLDREHGVALADLAYTLQVGREAMPERLGIVAGDIGELRSRLEAFVQGGGGAGVHRGCVDPRRGRKAAAQAGEGLEPLYLARDLAGLADAWTAGSPLQWERLHGERRPARIPLPTYPFARDRHWVAQEPAAMPAATAPAVLHPLVSYNSSTLSEVTFSSWLSAGEFYAQDHKVNGMPMFPGAGYLEIACVAGAIAGGRKVGRLRDVVWIQPLVFRDPSQLVQVSLQPLADGVEYLVTSFGDGQEKVVHAEGILCYADDSQAPAAPAPLLIEELKAQCTRQLDVGHYYRLFEQSGIVYGPAFRSMRELHVGPSFALSRLELAETLAAGFDQFVLHPSIVDGALQTVAALVGEGGSPTPFLPFAIDGIDILRPMSSTCYVHARLSDGAAAAESGIRKFDLTIVNPAGEVLVRIASFCVRAFIHSTEGAASGSVAGA